MIAKIALCALALLLAPAPEGEQKATAVENSKKVQNPKQVENSKELELLPIEVNIINYTNAERVKYGLAKLQIDRDLMKSARSHASWMAKNRNLVHTNRPVAENIAMGQPHSREAVRDWMNSSGHRANVLNRAHRRIGAAAYRTRGGTIYWCQQFRR